MNHPFNTRILCCIFLSASITNVLYADDKPAADLTAVARVSESLTASDAQQISIALLKTPDDPILHARLLGYFLAHKSDQKPDPAKHIAWMIEHHAEDSIAGSSYCEVDAVEDPDGYAKVKLVWDRQVGVQPSSVALLSNGAAFFARNNFVQADSLLQQCISLEPKNAGWPLRLAILYEHQMNAHSEDAVRLAALAVDLRQSAYNLTKDPTYRYHVMLQMPMDSFRGGDQIQSKRLAKELLGTSAKFRKDPNYGDAIHSANIVLGETALAAGNTDQADEFLAAAALTPGSVTLASTGPDFHLAKGLLAHGERAAVHDYLVACGKFWTSGTARLKSWTATLDSGGTPDF